MLNLETNNCKLEVREVEKGYRVKFIIGYDTDSDDTVSYSLTSNTLVDRIKDILNGRKIIQIYTDNSNIDLLVGFEPIYKQVFFSLVDYNANYLPSDRDMKKNYSLLISRENDNYSSFDSFFKIVCADVSLNKEGEISERKSNTVKY